MFRRRHKRAACARRVNSRSRHRFRRKLAVEPLEDRRLLSGVPDVVLLGVSGGPGDPPPDNGPRITDIVVVTGDEMYPLFGPQPAVDGPTPLVTRITIRVEDDSMTAQPPPGDYNDNGVVDVADYVVWRRFRGESIRLPNDPSPGEVDDEDYDTWRDNFGAVPTNSALNIDLADRVTSYRLSADRTGQVRIRDVMVNPLPLVAGEPAAATIELILDKPLADDRYTLYVFDVITDADGNELDGETDLEEPTFPTGNGEPGGNFVGRFNVDSRPEIGSRMGTDINVDLNGNRFFDPLPFSDPYNADLAFNLLVIGDDGLASAGTFGTHDQLFAGKFVKPNGDLPNRLFDQLAAYGYLPDRNEFRWLIDTDGDGIVRPATDIVRTQGPLSAFSVNTALAIAGNLETTRADDEIGLYSAGKWAFDTNGDRAISDADLFITNGLVGYPVVGDFDGDSNDDLAVFSNNTWYFDLAHDGLGGSDTAAGAATPSGGVADHTLAWGLPGTQDRPVAADMDQDGIDDIGLWVPDPATATAKWRFLMSNDPLRTRRVAGNINTLSHAFIPSPSGTDLYIEFGGDRSRPIVGNFGPPFVRADGAGSVLDSASAAPIASLQATGEFSRSFRAVERETPAKRNQFRPAVVDAAMADLNLVLTRARVALSAVSSSPSVDDVGSSTDADEDDGELAVRSTWEDTLRTGSSEG
jgi:hypothetical protein